MTRFARWLLALPVVALGYVFAQAWRVVGWGRIQGRVFGFEDARLVWASGPVAKWFGRRKWNGFTLGRHIWVWPRDGHWDASELRDFLQHECDGHVAQWLRLGILFPFVYLYQLARYGYTRKKQTLPLEVEARREAEKP